MNVSRYLVPICLIATSPALGQTIGSTSLAPTSGVYFWGYAGFTGCSNGTQTSVPVCKSANGSTVDPSNCTGTAARYERSCKTTAAPPPPPPPPVVSL